MLSLTEALARVLAELPDFGSERVTLAEAHGRVLHEPVVSTRAVPPWDNSAMDGYALRTADLAETDSLELVGEVAAGEVRSAPVRAGTAVAIMTGAPMPPGADTVVKVEDTDGDLAGGVVGDRVRFSVRPVLGANVRRRGEDIAEGDVVLCAGQRLTGPRLGLVASLGIPEVTVVRRPVVAVLATGDELVEPGQPLGPGQIYSSNSTAIVGLLRELNVIPVDAGIARDNVAHLTERLAWCIDNADVVVTTGGVSMGAYDLVRDVFSAVGAELDFWKVAMKPGKPLAFGWASRGGRRVPLFGLPGNPVSCVVNHLQFVRPFLLSAMGVPDAHLPVVRMTALAPIGARPGRLKLLRVVVERNESGALGFRSTGSQGSGVLTSLASAQGLLMVPPQSTGLAVGDQAWVQLIDAAGLGTSSGPPVL